MELNEKLYELRKKNNWSQEELAEKLNVSRQTISKWESNKAIPELDKLVRLSEIYNITLDELIKNSLPNETVASSSKKSKKKLKMILLIFLILLLFFSIAFSLTIIRRISIITDISKYYKEDFESIGVTQSGYITENITKRDSNTIEETYKQYFYYVSESGEKLVKVVSYENANSDDPLKEVYIDLAKENEEGLFDQVTEIDKTNRTRKVVDNYRFDSPIRKVTDSLNSYYSFICIGDKIFSDTEMGFDFNNEFAKKGESYVWNNPSINNSKNNIGVSLHGNERFLMIFDNYPDDIEEHKELVNILMDTTRTPEREDVIAPRI